MILAQRHIPFKIYSCEKLESVELLGTYEFSHDGLLPMIKSNICQ